MTLPNPYTKKVIIVHMARGEGTPDDPCREVVQVYGEDGSFVAENDPHLLSERQRVKQGYDKALDRLVNALA